MTEMSLLIKEYSRHPVGQGRLSSPDTTYCQVNSICGDSIIVDLQIEQGVITAYGHSGEPAIHTLVAASLLAELIEGKSIDEVLTRNYTTIKELGFEVSPRRKRSAVSALLAVRNAIHTYLDDGVEDSYDDLLTG